MALNLEKGQNAKINMDIFLVGLGWDVNEDESSGYDFDLDVSAFLIGENKKTPTEEYLVFYNSENRIKWPDKNQKSVKWDKTLDFVRCNNETGSPFRSNEAMRQESRPVDPDLSVVGSIDDEDGLTSEDGDDEIMDINLSKVKQEIKEIVITVSIHKWKERRQNFGQVERAYVRLYKPGQADGEGEYIYDLTEDFSTCASVEFCRLYRRGSEWKIQALGVGHKGGLEELINKYIY